MPLQPALPVVEKDKWVAVASGLCVGDPAVDAPRLMLLVDWLKGMLGDTELCQQVCRLIICGAPCPTCRRYFLGERSVIRNLPSR